MIPHRTQCAECRSEVNFCQVGPRRQAQARLAGRNRGRPEAPARTPERAQIRWASRAAPGSPIVIRTTAAAGGGTWKPSSVAMAARRCALACARRPRPGSSRMMASAMRAAATLGGARPVSKMNARPHVDEGADDPGGAGDRAALAGQRLGQRECPDDVRVARDAGRGGHAAAARAEHAERVCLVQHEQRLVGAGGPVQFGDGRLVPGDGEHRVAHHDGRGLGAAGEGLLDRAGVGVRGDHDAGTGQPAGVDQRGVVGGVGNDEDARPGAAGTEGLRQGRDDREVGQVPRGEDERGGRPGEGGQLVFQLGVQLRRPGDQA